MILKTGRWSETELDNIIHQASTLRSRGEKVEYISRQFLGTPYRESTLRGTIDTEEVLVIDLEGVDCFTLLDYVEAMRISGSFDSFTRNIVRVRYRGGKISFSHRNHFFTDWREYGAGRIEDATGMVGGGRAEKALKTLNLREDGSCFLPGIEAKKREISFIPSAVIDSGIIGRLESGDYIGIYSALGGLDVSHAGILIKAGSSVYLRHASSGEGVRKVVDEGFLRYASGVPGIVVLRQKDR